MNENTPFFAGRSIFSFSTGIGGGGVFSFFIGGGGVFSFLAGGDAVVGGGVLSFLAGGDAVFPFLLGGFEPLLLLFGGAFDCCSGLGCVGAG
jgi:hypothetical protein